MLFNLENINCRSQESNLKNIIQGLLLLTSMPNQTTQKKTKKDSASGNDGNGWTDTTLFLN
jgi:hypothetical protein